jgi:CelD/BcsL family acetyltransferase involved in cellulose biosynthesis
LVCSDTSTISIQPVTTSKELVALRSEWTQLFKRCPDAAPFQSPDWLLPWWTWFGDGELLAFVFRKEEQLVGLALTFIYASKDFGQQLLLLGTGNSDYCDVLFEPSAQAECCQLLFGVIEEHRGWDVCDLQPLRAESVLISANSPPDWRTDLAQQDVCPRIKLSRHRLANSKALGKMLKNANYSRRRLEKAGPVRIEPADDNTFHEIFEAFRTLHQARWRARGHSGVFADETARAFHCEAAAALLEAGILRLYALRVSHHIIGCLYCLVHARRAHYYLGGFDDRFAPYSPGVILIGHAIEDAVQQGALEFDFLRGNESYKYRWGAEDHPTYLRRFWR